MGIVDFIVVAGIAVGLYRRRGRNLQWIRRRLDIDSRARAFPAILRRSVEDVRSLGDDLLGLLSPRARRRVEDRARSLRGGGTRAFQRLQRRYLDGSITLENYVEEAERLQLR